ncbi:hypothetical protein [Neobacillus sp. PS2-9]|uniref:hypothetical protein n=1 Tax=Neobacillus sp. PS2-9 TaxID=3070676 RepID=UPI0027E08228|nr:hypothetical protein [Neobacillus sp. PS2-9]WML59307.1 hypothetical protein RCG25_05770 [Neobacillus sp. PS2-9]
MFKKIYLFLKRKREILKGFQRNTKYMCAGIYVYDDSLKYITRNDSYTKNRALQIFQNNYYQAAIKVFIFLLRKTFFRKKVEIVEPAEQKNEFSGSVYRPVRSSNGYNDSKIFDLSRNQVLSIFSNKQEYQSVLSIYQSFKKFFPMPAILQADAEQLIIMEELVNFEQNHTWIEEDYLFVMEDVFERNINYFKACVENGIQSSSSPTDLISQIKMNAVIEPIRNKINPELLDVKFPCVKLHGDLWTSNTLLVKEGKSHICYIDWEYSREYIFFYDLFNMMWLEVYVNNNHLYIHKYIKGEYNNYFYKLFSLFNLSFDEKLKLDYIIIYFLNFFTERGIHLGTVEQVDILDKFKRMLDRLREMIKNQSKQLISVDNDD